jgi:hypothetical protein
VVAVRRRTTVSWTSAIVLLAGLTACGSDRSTPTLTLPPAHHAISRSVAHTHEARGILTDPRARLGAFAVVSGHPERRISLWYLCRDHDCTRRLNALAVTDDGFRHSHLVDVPAVGDDWHVEPAGPDHFAISGVDGRRRLVGLAGQVTPIRVLGAAGPLAGREVPLGTSKAAFLAVDPDTGEAHSLPTPAGVIELGEGPAGQLRAVSLSAYSWSGDGGATWQHLALHVGADLPQLVPTVSAHVHAVLVGADGATLFPWIRILTSTDGAAWTSYAGPGVPTAYVDTPVLLPDDRLLINVETWSDQRAGKPAPRPVGLYTGNDVSAPSPVSMGAPFDASPNRSIVDILDVAVKRQSVTVYARAPDRARVFSSTDDGVTWRPEPAR